MNYTTTNKNTFVSFIESQTIRTWRTYPNPSLDRWGEISLQRWQVILSKVKEPLSRRKGPIPGWVTLIHPQTIKTLALSTFSSTLLPSPVTFPILKSKDWRYILFGDIVREGVDYPVNRRLIFFYSILAYFPHSLQQILPCCQTRTSTWFRITAVLWAL